MCILLRERKIFICNSFFGIYFRKNDVRFREGKTEAHKNLLELE